MQRPLAGFTLTNFGVLVLFVRATPVHLAHTCGAEGSVGVPNLGPHNRPVYRSQNLCICPLATQCSGEGCRPLVDLIRKSSKPIVGPAMKMQGFSVSCPNCTCVPNKNEIPHRFLFLINGAEGMSSWRVSIASILFLARTTNRVLVLPCVSAGRLVPCLPTRSTLRFQDYINKDKLRSYGARFEEYSEFIGRSDSSELFASARTVICAHLKCRPKKNAVSATAGIAKLFSMQAGENPLAIISQQAGHNATIERLWNYDFLSTVARIESLGRMAVVGALFRGMFRPPSPLSISHLSHETFGVPQYWDFAESLYSNIPRLREKLGISTSYLAVHWRSEATKCNFTSCAERLAAGIQHLISTVAADTEPNATTPRRCLLVSDIPIHPEQSLWGPFQDDLKKRSAQQSGDFAVLGMQRALKILGVTASVPWGGCSKIDTLLHPQQMDIGLISIYNKILAASASHFYTCQKKRGGHCSGCGRWQSNFAKEVLGLRSKVVTAEPLPNLHVSSAHDWPAPLSQA